MILTNNEALTVRWLNRRGSAEPYCRTAAHRPVEKSGGLAAQDWVRAPWNGGSTGDGVLTPDSPAAPQRLLSQRLLQCTKFRRARPSRHISPHTRAGTKLTARQKRRLLVAKPGRPISLNKA
jgi:hypothetical protein